jgi:hypothetical protein
VGSALWVWFLIFLRDLTLITFFIWAKQALFKYCNSDDPRLLEWSSKFEEVYGVRIQDLAPTPPDCTQDLRPPPPVQGRLHPASSSGGSRSSTPCPRNPLEATAPQMVTSPAFAPPGRTPADTRFFCQPSFPGVRSQAHQPLPPQPEPREKSLRSTGHDVNIDPVLQVPANPRAQMSTDPLLAVSPALSLPSLKSSGLLDWQRANEGAPPAAAAAASANWPPPGQHRAVVRQESQDATQSPFPSASHIDHSTSTRPTAATASTSMPVGLPWLASESTVSRTG